MLEEEKKENLNSSHNIFEDFSTDANLSEDITNLEKQKKHDSIYYLSISSSLLKGINIILLFLLILSFFYITIQKKQDPIGIDFLEPICWLFLWDTPPFNTCSWINYVKQEYNKDLEETKKFQFWKISSIIGNLYSFENFIYSKEVSFLLDRARNRVKPIEIISKFDTIKNKFDPIEKWRIQCYDIIIEKTNLLRMTCESYSSDWDKSIIWFAWTKDSQDVINGTSISLANSFINFINKNSKDFTIINKQKIFSTEPFFGNWSYTKKTIFELSLKYNDNNL